MQFKWVDAKNLDQWAESISARTQVAALVGDLIRATAVNVKSFRFPSGDAGETPGFDGFLESVEAPPYVPAGLSIWEFGTRENAESKANEDYASRTNNPLHVDPRKATFVFVTPRIWPKAAQWADARRAEKIWGDVRAYDAVDVEEWLLRRPSVASVFASRVLRKSPISGVISGEDFWHEQAIRTNPPTIEALLLAGREEPANQLTQILLGEPQNVVIRADSPDEAITYLMAAIRSAPSKAQAYLLSRTLGVSEEEAASVFKGYSG